MVIRYHPLYSGSGSSVQDLQNVGTANGYVPYHSVLIKRNDFYGPMHRTIRFMDESAPGENYWRIDRGYSSADVGINDFPNTQTLQDTITGTGGSFSLEYLMADHTRVNESYLMTSSLTLTTPLKEGATNIRLTAFVGATSVVLPDFAITPPLTLTMSAVLTIRSIGAAGTCELHGMANVDGAIETFGSSTPLAIDTTTTNTFRFAIAGDGTGDTNNHGSECRRYGPSEFSS